MSRSDYTTFDFLLYVRLQDMQVMCEAMAKQAKVEGAAPGLADRLVRAAKAFGQMMETVKHGDAQRRLL